MADYWEAVRRKLAEETPEERRAFEEFWARIDAAPLEFVPLGEGWLARRAGFVGTGATQAKARESLDNTIWLHLAPPGAEWAFTGQPPPGLRKPEDEP